MRGLHKGCHHAAVPVAADGMTAVEAVDEQYHLIDLQDRRRTLWQLVVEAVEHAVGASEVIVPWPQGAFEEWDRRAR